MPDRIEITEFYIERVAFGINEGELSECEAIRQAYSDTKRVKGEVTEEIKQEYRRKWIDRFKKAL